jgi:ABC-type transporter lipoprotein component MlaA
VRRIKRSAMVVRSALAVAVAAVVFAGAPKGAAATGTAGDPVESLNRGFFELNGLLRPAFRAALQAVDEIVAPGLLQALRNLSNNLAEPGVALGHLAMGDVAEARLALKRFLINGVEGPLGLRDIAAAEGVPPRPVNLRDVLCHFQVPPGPYLVLPLFGDTTLRGAVAQVTTLGAAFAAFGEYYVGYRIMTYLLAVPAPPPPLLEMRFLENGLPDPYAAVRAHRQTLEQTACRDEPGVSGPEPPRGGFLPAPPPVAKPSDGDAHVALGH